LASVAISSGALISPPRPPAVPAWQLAATVHTPNTPPPFTFLPQARSHVPVELNFSTRLLPDSLTYTLPLGSVAIPSGSLISPPRAPVVPVWQLAATVHTPNT